MMAEDENRKVRVIAVVGPTASGKTGLAVELALRLGGEIVSADSMQIYKDISIGTAKPTAEEMRGVPHHLMDFVPLDRDYSVADYVRDAKREIAGIDARGAMPFVVGGTGLYIDSLLENIRFDEMEADVQLRAELRGFADRYGAEALHDELRKIDPELAEKLHPNNIGRVIRAIEVYRLTGKTMSEQQRLSRAEDSQYDVFWIGLTFRNRENLYARIDARVDEMMKNGLVDEARALYGRKLSSTATQAIGYKELFDYFDGKQSLAEAADGLKRSTRRYAKRQLTWFRRNNNVNWVYMDEPEGYNDNIPEYLTELMKLQRFALHEREKI